MNENTRRAFFYGMGALYVIYLAVQMLSGMETVSEVNPILIIMGAVFLAIAGIGILIFALKIAKKDRDEEKNSADESETTGKRMGKNHKSRR